MENLVGGNPLTQERLARLRDSAQEVLTEFSKLYVKKFGLAVFNKMVEVKETTDKRLRYRDFDSVPRQLVHGGCYVKKGQGAGSFAGFKQLYVVERQDYNIDLYSSERTYQTGGSPSETIRTGGYTVETNVSAHYKQEVRHLATGLGMTEIEVEGITQFSTNSWALAHPNRTNYVFQLLKPNNSICPCFGFGSTSGSDDEEPEQAEQRRHLVAMMKKCVRRVHPRDLNSLRGKAFEDACKSIGEQVKSLNSWKDNGAETEMLVDMLMEACLPELRDGMFSDMKGPVCIRVVIWYKARGVIQSTLRRLVDPAWTQMQSACDAAQDKIEPAVRRGQQPITAVKETVTKKVKGILLDKLALQLALSVTPFIKPLLTALDQPMASGFKHGRDIFVNNVKVAELPDNQQARNEILDAIPREAGNMAVMKKSASQLVSPLELVKKLSKQMFEDLDTDDLSQQAEDALLTTLDAAVYTLETKLDAATEQREIMKSSTLKDYDHDVIAAISDFMQEAVKATLLPPFKKLVEPVTKPVKEEMNDEIPKDMQDYVDIEQIVDDTIESIVGSPIEKMVDEAYPRPRL